MNIRLNSDKKKSILIIDDVIEVLENLKTVVTDEGYRAIVSTDGHDALLKFGNERFDFIICDIIMPKMSGSNLLKHLRHIEGQKKIDPPTPILFISGELSEFAKEVQLMDDAAFLQKPFTGTELLAKIAPFFESKSQKNVVTALKKNLAAGEFLIKENSTENEMYWVVSGSFEVIKEISAGSGKYKKIGEIIQGELVGEMSFLTESVRSASVRAITDSEVVVIPNSKFVEVLDKQPRWFQTLLRTLANRLKDADNKLVSKD
jgi:CRP/FNR family cyclic AMP-dependent transcriptional regulator